MTKKGSFLGGVLLVSGTTVGVGMLAMPVVTSVSGFIPSLFFLILIWFLMSYTAFLLLEANLWMKEEVNLISIVRKTLGRRAAALCGITYLFLLYCLITAYLSTSADALSDVCLKAFDLDFPKIITALPYLLLFGMFVYLGTSYADRFNRVLMLGLVISYLLLVCMLPEHVNLDNLKFVNWKGSYLGISYIILSFGYHIIIPTLVNYYHRDVALLKKTLWVGSLLPLLIYIVWQYLVLGVIPLFGDQGLFSIWVEKKRVIPSLEMITKSSFVTLGARWFECFAVLTSFIGVALSLVDFLADIIHLLFKIKTKTTGVGKLFLCFLAFVPSYIFCLTHPKVFYDALNAAGVFGVVILLMIYPVAIVWVGRKRFSQPQSYRVAGGKLFLCFILFFSFLSIVVFMCEQFGILNECVFDGIFIE